MLMDFHRVRILGIQKGFQVERSLSRKRVRISFKGAPMRRPDGTVSYSFKEVRKYLTRFPNREAWVSD